MGSAEAETLVRRSRFLARALPVSSQEEVRNQIKYLKARYSDANHVCHAFVLGGGNSRIQGCSDDGEPAGTAGRPILAVLEGSEIKDVLVAVIRYFGGIKLGTGGLVQAYGAAARAVLELLPVREDIPQRRVRLDVDYANLQVLERRVQALEGVVERQEFGARVLVELLLPTVGVESLKAWHADATRGAGSWEEL